MPTQLDQTHSMFDDLVRDALGILLPAIALLVWLWGSYVALFDPLRVGYGFAAVGLLLPLVVITLQLRTQKLRLSVAAFLIGLILIVTTAAFGYANKEVFSLYAQIIFIAAVVAGLPTMLLVTAVVTGLTMALGRHLGLEWEAIRWALFLQVITALIATLSSRRLFTALEWALTMTLQTQQNAEEARSHRSELQRALQSLDIALSRLERANRALAFAQEAADKAYRFKSDFVANVSHELRTPLNLIVGFSEMMTTAPESYGGVQLPREYRGDMLATYRSARHLLDLINDVLDLSQLESGRMAIFKERVILQEVVDETVDIVRGLAEVRKLELRCDLPSTPIVLDLDRVRVRQVLLNLLTNAMRYTQRGWVSIAAQASAQAVTITVADSGRGISADKIHRAFETFDRLDEEPLHEGSGLGLAISKKFVELHDGQMWIESEVGKGTTVYFTLKLPTAEERLPIQRLHLSRPLTYEQGKPLILVIHDDARATELLRRHVAQCEFAQAQTIAEATIMTRYELPQVVITDSGDLTRWQTILTAIPALAHVPVVSCPLPSMRQVGMLLGATDYLPKPVGRNDLAAALERLQRPLRTVLVIDDDPHIVRLISRMLCAITPMTRVVEAFGGEEGLAVAKAQQPDAIFVDLMMPGMNGHKFIEAARKHENLSATPIIVVSVRSVEEETMPVMGGLHLQRGAGFSVSELLAMLQSLLATLTQADAVSPANAVARLPVAAD